jgi:hypothetical protein
MARGEWWMEPAVWVILTLTGLLALWAQNENSPRLARHLFFSVVAAFVATGLLLGALS